jgi:phosphoglycolate phosphatase
VTFSVACLDMAGTTVRDEGTVMAAFQTALRTVGVPTDSDAEERAIGIARATMGQSKVEVFRLILGTDLPAQRANDAFEQAYLAAIRGGDIEALPGAESTFAALRGGGVQVCLTTGFAPPIRDAILDCLGWREQVDLALSPADAGRGRPFPDLVLTAFLRLGAERVADVVVVGDTVSDVESGLRAGAGLVVGVGTGTASAAELTAAGAHQVLAGVGELPALLASR